MSDDANPMTVRTARGLKDRTVPGARLAFIGGDLGNLTDHPRFVDAMCSAFGRIDCPVNNAGVSAKSRGDLLDVSVDSYDLNFVVKRAESSS